jgi:protein-S-isoprenylcysteine O-methyltransferase Ste14
MALGKEFPTVTSQKGLTQLCSYVKLPRTLSLAPFPCIMLKIVSIFGYFGMIGGLLGLLAQGNIFSSSPLVITSRALAVLLFIWARITFGWRSYHVSAGPTEGGVVTGGPYRYVRHPIYAAMCLFALAGAAGDCSWIAGLCIGLVFASAVIRILCEETLVAARYPEYSQYAAATWRLIPYVY